MSLTPQWLDELRSRITLSTVISRTTRLTKAGREFKACCPFHNEKSPSFTVNDEKGFYHCFGCAAHGDAIKWMTDQRGLSFMDAVKELAAEAGMEVPALDPRAAKVAEQRGSLHDVMAATQKWFVENLASPEGAKARAYLATRGFDPHTIVRFGFGYAPEVRQALPKALGDGFEPKDLIEAGLRIVVDNKEPYDRFRGRLMLPIEDARGRVIAFGGRILDKDKTDAPKYLNSPDTPLFDKGRTLYNIHRASPASRQTGRVIVVEGYMDVIAMAAAGIHECVAPMGTALTEKQLELLWRMAETPTLCFDGDAAGQRAAIRAIARALPLLRPAHSLKIVSLPTGVDPDDLIKADGPAGIEKVLGEARSLLNTLWDHEHAASPLVTPEDKAGLKARLMAHVDTIAHPDIQALYRRELLSQFSAFAFPPRDWSGHKNVSDITSARKWQSRQTGRTSNRFGKLEFLDKASDELVHKHAKPTDREAHLHRRLGAAIAGGLLGFPSLILNWAETILKVPDVDGRLVLMAEASFDYADLDDEQLVTIFKKHGLSRPEPNEWDNLRFPFVWPPADRNDAEEGLEKAMRLYAGIPQVRLALRHATESMGTSLTDQSWAEQQRLLKRAMAFQAELRQMAATA